MIGRSTIRKADPVSCALVIGATALVVGASLGWLAIAWWIP